MERFGRARNRALPRGDGRLGWLGPGGAGPVAEPTPLLDKSLRLFAPFVPYAVVPFGLYGLRSAWAAMLLYHVGMVLVGGGVGGTRQASSLVRGRADPTALLLGLACLLAGPAIGLAWPLMSGGAGLAAPLEAVGLSTSNLLAFAIYYATVNPLLEEWYWRGVLGGPPRGPTTSDVAFGGYHVVVLVAFVPWPWALGVGLVLTGAGWLWRQVAARQGGLLVPVVTHAVADVSVIAAAVLLAGRVGA